MHVMHSYNTPETGRGIDHLHHHPRTLHLRVCSRALSQMARHVCWPDPAVSRFIAAPAQLVPQSPCVGGPGGQATHPRVQQRPLVLSPGTCCSFSPWLLGSFGSDECLPCIALHSPATTQSQYRPAQRHERNKFIFFSKITPIVPLKLMDLGSLAIQKGKKDVKKTNT